MLKRGKSQAAMEFVMRYAWAIMVFFVAVGETDTFFDGRVNEVGFWRRILSSQKRSDLYNNGNGNTYNP